MCIKQMGKPVLAAASTAPSRPKARTSLIIPTPASAPANMTFGVLVSRDTSTSNRFLMQVMAPRTRSISSCSETASAPGRVDSPPTSKKEAPASTIVSAAWHKASKFRPEPLKSAPPSEKESGVTLRMPITKGFLKESSRSGQTNRVGPKPGIFMASTVT